MVNVFSRKWKCGYCDSVTEPMLALFVTQAQSSVINVNFRFHPFLDDKEPV
jgi:hypothetical protein